MFKNIIILALFALFIGGAMTADSCSDNPIVGKLETFIETLKDSYNDNKDETEISDIIGQIKKASKKIVTGLKKCKAYEGKDSCCTKDQVKIFPKIFGAYFRKAGRRAPKSKQFIHNTAMSIARCAGDSRKEYNNELKPLLEELRQCRSDDIKVNINWFRGIACGICMDPAEIANRFDAKKIKVTQASATKLDEELTAASKCTNDVTEKILTITKDFVDELGDKCKKVKDTVKEQVEQPAITVIEEITDNYKGKKAFSSANLEAQEAVKPTEEKDAEGNITKVGFDGKVTIIKPNGEKKKMYTNRKGENISIEEDKNGEETKFEKQTKQKDGTFEAQIWEGGRKKGKKTIKKDIPEEDSINKDIKKRKDEMKILPIEDKPVKGEPVKDKPVDKPVIGGETKDIKNVKGNRRILEDDEDDFVVDDVNGINGYEEDNDDDTKAEFTMADWGEQIDGESYPEEDTDEESSEEKNGNSGSINNFFMAACCALLAFILI